ncbi:alpha-(1-_3)-arabinofuranosyltransferase domain-containing protein [Nocardioides bigeumensis]|uniref:Alpha-(1->3)-arabinofuranosyltransferase n=1 Tax=Nocardioides bigeumensis TaxID=433657 RepID=A0ABN2XW12_9ACTN
MSDPSGPAEGPIEGARTRFRVRLAAGCLLLGGLAFVQDPGSMVADTKFDLAVDPGAFLARALHLWDPQGALGQLQNQAYGYLWPMGPFFWIGDLLDAQGWVVQRLWLATVLSVAFVGTALLARALGVRSDLACLVAGAAYALSPRMLSTLGPISIEAWPSALAPWVLLPLVLGSERGSPRRAAGLSALAIAMVGGVNAAATFAVIPLGALWLLTRRGGPRRRRLLFWWPVLTLLGTLWWLVPLFVMGGYSPPFLDFIESSTNTTFPTTPFDVLRGTSNWTAYVDGTQRAGNDLLRQSVLVVNSGVLLLLGLAGLMAARTRERAFLALGVGLGLVLVGMGHVGSTAGWGSGDLRSLLDGVLSPLRNVHKFDPVVRLPLALGLAWTVEHLLRDRAARGEDGAMPSLSTRSNALVLVGAAVVAVLGAALPAVNARIPPAGAVQTVPGYWRETAAWLEREDATALLVPGSSFAQYVWGAPRDEPLQFLYAGRWAVRNAVPLTPPGNIRTLDALETRWAEGRGSRGLTGALRRAGVTHLVLRNDLQRSIDVPDPVLVHQAIAQTPGLARVATFGPDVGGGASLEPDEDFGRIVVNDGWQDDYPAVEVYALDASTPAVRVAGEPPVVVGGPEDLPDLVDLGVLDDQPTELAVDAGTWDPNREVVLTDGLRDVERHFGRVHDGTSSTLAPEDPRRMPNRWADYLDPGSARWTTKARHEGAAAVEASSSMSDANALPSVQPGRLPYAAVDDDPATAWWSNRVSEPAWWRLTFDEPVDLDQVTVTAGPESRENVRLRTVHGVSDTATLEPGSSRTFSLEADLGGDVGWLQVEDGSGAAVSSLALAEVDVPGVSVRRTLVLPQLPAGSPVPGTIVLRALTDARTGCVDVDAAVRCAAGRAVASEEPAGFRRAVTLPGTAAYDPELTVRPRPGVALDELIQRDRLAGATASSTGPPDPRASALAAVDGDLGTTWTAADSDLRPTLSLRWVGQRRVSGLTMQVAEDSPARLPRTVRVRWPEGSVRVEVDDGRVRLPTPVVTDQLTVVVKEAEPATSLDFDSVASFLPVGIGELRVIGVPAFPIQIDPERRELPCGSGPTIQAGGRSVSTAVTASMADLYAGATLPARVCSFSGLVLGPRENLVDVRASAQFAPVALVLSARGSRLPDGHVIAGGADLGDPVSRTLIPEGGAGSGDAVVWVAENANTGWEARQDRLLEPVVVDGWQQGWRLDGSSTAVRATFGPDDLYRAGLGVGAVTFGLLVLLVVARPRRRWAPHPVLSSARLRWPVAVVLAGGVGGLVVGTTGALVAVGAGVASAVAARWAPEVAPWVLASTLVPAVAAYAARPWGSGDGWAGALDWPHYLVVAVVACVIGASSSAGARPGGSRRWAKRMAGRSTSR